VIKIGTMGKLLAGLKDKIILFLSLKDMNILIVLPILGIERIKGDHIIYCDSSKLIRYIVRRVEREHGVLFSPKTRFIAVKELYIDREYTKFREFIPSTKDTIVDVGAETGDYTILCSKFYNVSQVLSFEPNNASYEVLIQNIELNKCHNVSAFMIGLSSVEAQQRAFFNGDSIIWTNNQDNYSLTVRKLDSFGLTSLSLLKIDVEGNEIEVIKGAIETIKKFRPRIIVETHSKVLKETVIDLLTGLDYSISHAGRSFINDSNDEVVNIFFLNRSADAMITTNIEYTKDSGK
jgi:FkbM family methyltransferase